MSFDGNGDPKLATEAIFKAKRGNWVYLGSRSYESQVKPGTCAGATRKAIRLVDARRPTSTTRRSSRRATASRATSILETRLSAAAYKFTEYIGSPKTVDVACWSRQDWPGVADDDDIYSTFGFWMGDMPHWVHLSPETCRGIETLFHNRPAYPNAFTADAIQTLTPRDDARPRRGQRGRGRVPRHAGFRRARGGAGVPKHYALRLAHLNLENYVDLPPEYIDKKRCRENGVWDLRQNEQSPPWHGV